MGNPATMYTPARRYCNSETVQRPNAADYKEIAGQIVYKSAGFGSSQTELGRMCLYVQAYKADVIKESDEVEHYNNTGWNGQFRQYNSIIILQYWISYSLPN